MKSVARQNGKKFSREGSKKNQRFPDKTCRQNSARVFCRRADKFPITIFAFIDAVFARL